MIWNVGDRALFVSPAMEDLEGEVTITRKVGSPSDPYQWAVSDDDGRDWVCKDKELVEIV